MARYTLSRKADGAAPGERRRFAAAAWGNRSCHHRRAQRRRSLGGSMTKNPLVSAKAGSRRTFLKAAGAAAAGATLGFPMIAKGQAGPISMRWQSTWPSKDIFHEFALDYAKKVNELSGGARQM